MYSPLNQELMFQQVQDRKARATAVRGTSRSDWPNRRWFRKETRSAG